MSRYAIVFDVIPNYDYTGSTMFRDAANERELEAVIAEAKEMSAVYRIRVNGIPYMERDSAHSQWRRCHE